MDVNKYYDNFTDDVFEIDEWSKETITGYDELKDALLSLNIVGRTIEDIVLFGADCNYDMGGLTDLPDLDDSEVFDRGSAIDVPVIIVFEDGDQLEYFMPDLSVHMLSMNRIPTDIETDLEYKNIDGSALYAPCIGRTIIGIEVGEYHSDNPPFGSEYTPSGNHFVKYIILRLDDGNGIKLYCNFSEFFEILYVNDINEAQKIEFSELKDAVIFSE